MFKSKYIFETRSTKIQRYIKNLILFSLSMFILYSLLCVIFILFSNFENQNTNEALFQKHPDLIVVFTGDVGRIPYAIRKAEEYKHSNIFITGVYSANNVETILTPLKGINSIDPDLLQIDYLAHNTVENVISTMRYLRKNKGIKKVLIISHDYHIMRIKLLVNSMQNQNQQIQFFYTGIPTNYKKLRNLKVLYKEVYKLFRAYGFVLFWDPEV